VACAPRPASAADSILVYHDNIPTSERKFIRGTQADNAASNDNNIATSWMLCRRHVYGLWLRLLRATMRVYLEFGAKD
jgi:hypothetical protein